MCYLEILVFLKFKDNKRNQWAGERDEDNCVYKTGSGYF